MRMPQSQTAADRCRTCFNFVVAVVVIAFAAEGCRAVNVEYSWETFGGTHILNFRPRTLDNTTHDGGVDTIVYKNCNFNAFEVGNTSDTARNVIRTNVTFIECTFQASDLVLGGEALLSDVHLVDSAFHFVKTRAVLMGIHMQCFTARRSHIVFDQHFCAGSMSGSHVHPCISWNAGPSCASELVMDQQSQLVVVQSTFDSFNGGLSVVGGLVVTSSVIIVEKNILNVRNFFTEGSGAIDSVFFSGLRLVQSSVLIRGNSFELGGDSPVCAVRFGGSELILDSHSSIVIVNNTIRTESAERASTGVAFEPIWGLVRNESTVQYMNNSHVMESSQHATALRFTNLTVKGDSQLLISDGVWTVNSVSGTSSAIVLRHIVLDASRVEVSNFTARVVSAAQRSSLIVWTARQSNLSTASSFTVSDIAVHCEGRLGAGLISVEELGGVDIFVLVQRIEATMQASMGDIHAIDFRRVAVRHFSVVVSNCSLTMQAFGDIHPLGLIHCQPCNDTTLLLENSFVDAKANMGSVLVLRIWNSWGLGQNVTIRASSLTAVARATSTAFSLHQWSSQPFLRQLSTTVENSSILLDSRSASMTEGHGRARFVQLEGVHPETHWMIRSNSVSVMAQNSAVVIRVLGGAPLGILDGQLIVFANSFHVEVPVRAGEATLLFMQGILAGTLTYWEHNQVTLQASRGATYCFRLTEHAHSGDDFDDFGDDEGSNTPPPQAHVNVSQHLMLFNNSIVANSSVAHLLECEHPLFDSRITLHRNRVVMHVQPHWGMEASVTRLLSLERGSRTQVALVENYIERIGLAAADVSPIMRVLQSTSVRIMFSANVFGPGFRFGGMSPDILFLSSGGSTDTVVAARDWCPDDDWRIFRLQPWATFNAAPRTLAQNWSTGNLYTVEVLPCNVCNVLWDCMAPSGQSVSGEPPFGCDCHCGEHPMVHWLGPRCTLMVPEVLIPPPTLTESKTRTPPPTHSISLSVNTSSASRTPSANTPSATTSHTDSTTPSSTGSRNTPSGTESRSISLSDTEHIVTQSLSLTVTESVSSSAATHSVSKSQSRNETATVTAALTSSGTQTESETLLFLQPRMYILHPRDGAVLLESALKESQSFNLSFAAENVTFDCARLHIRHLLESGTIQADAHLERQLLLVVSSVQCSPLAVQVDLITREDFAISRDATVRLELRGDALLRDIVPHRSAVDIPIPEVRAASTFRVRNNVWEPPASAVPPEVVKQAQNAGFASAVTAAVSANPLQSMAVARSSIVLDLLHCGDADVSALGQPLRFIESPTGAAVGDGPLRYLAGASGANSLIVAVVLLGNLIAAAVALAAAAGGNGRPQPTFLEAMARVRCPSLVLIVALPLFESTASAAAAALLDGGAAGLQFFAAAGGAFLAVVVLGAMITITVVFFAAHFLWRDGSPEDEPVRHFFLGGGDWVDNKDNEDARDGGESSLPPPCFVRRFSFFFEQYRMPHQWFGCVEVGVVILLSLAKGLRPSSQAGCTAVLGAAGALCVLLLLLFCVLRPYVAPFNAIIAPLIVSLQATSAICGAIYLHNRSYDVTFVIAGWTATLSLYFLTAKACADLIVLLWTTDCTSQRSVQVGDDNGSLSGEYSSFSSSGTGQRPGAASPTGPLLEAPLLAIPSESQTLAKLYELLVQALSEKESQQPSNDGESAAHEVTTTTTTTKGVSDVGAVAPALKAKQDRRPGYWHL